ncbi:30S ribosomal protein S6 [Spiroplasma endosymbiont of Labia minor]|uniref:30S ribosomal protein S6 n=1 Tax=Spiroplasma endosymbiont of Labia minor TaxID=3066305 RepID=UPI0030D27502
MIRKYEVMYIIDQDAKDLNLITSKLNDALTANGGKIVEQAEWGLKNFAYSINHKNKGYYFVLIVNTEAANINEMKRIAGIDKNVIRVLVINTESESHYEQSTVYAKTDMTKFKEEKKPAGPRFERKFRSRNESDGNAGAKFKTEAPANKPTE